MRSVWEWTKAPITVLFGSNVKIIQIYGELMVGNLSAKPFCIFLHLFTTVLLIKPCHNIMAVKNLFNTLEAMFV